MSKPEKYMPDFGDPRTWRNLSLAVGIPGALAFALSRATGNRLARKEALEFEEQVRQAVQAENPVIYLDPRLDDMDAQEAASSFGLVDPATAKKKGKAGTAGGGRFPVLRRIRDRLLGRKSETSEAPLPPAPRTQATRPSAADVPVFTGKLEPGTLVALAWLSTLAGWRLGRKSGAKVREVDAKIRERELENRLEQAEYKRLHLANDPEGFLSTLSPRTAASDLDLSGHMAALLSKRAEGGWLEKQWDRMTTSAEYAYPSIFLALLLGGYGIGKHYGDKTDALRERNRNLKKVLAEEMLANQSPAIVSVGSDLPWEKAKRMAPGAAADPSVPLPADAAHRRLMDSREIRI